MQTKASKHVLLVALSLTISGCALNYVIDENAYRLSAESTKAANEDLFRNIVRASYSHPLHFSSITTLRGGNSGEASVGITLPLSTSSQGSFTVTPNLGISQGPSFELAPQLSKAFAQGILQPQTLERLSLFTEPQYNIEAVYTLFFDRIEILSQTGGALKLQSGAPLLLPGNKQIDLNKGVPTIFYNSLKDPSDFAQFQLVLRNLIQSSGLSTEIIDIQPPATPFVEMSGTKAPIDLIPMAEKKLVPEYCRTESGKKLVRLLRWDPIKVPRMCLLRENPFCGQPSTEYNEEIKDCPRLSSPENREFAQRDASSVSKTVTGNVYVFHLRSVYEMIFYLGDIINNIRERKEIKNFILPCVAKYKNNLEAQAYDLSREEEERAVQECKAERDANLNPEIFFDVKAESDPGSFVSVDYNNRTHSILSGSRQSGNTTQVMEILTQLLNLSRSPEDIQRSPTVVLSQ